MHRLKPLRWLAFLLGLGVALAIAGAGVRPGRGLQIVGGWSTDGTCSWDAPNPPAGDDYELELVNVFPGCSSSYLIAGFDEQGLPIISASHMTTTKPERAIAGYLFNARGETLAMLEEKWAVCPTGARLPEPEVLAWWPESWYERVHEERIVPHRVDRFRWNFSRDFKLMHTNSFERALNAAGRGDSLAVYTRLLATVPGYEERLRIPVDPLYSADGGIAFTDGDRHFAVLKTDGGYHNVDTFYMLFAQLALSAGSEYPLLGIADIEGGHRGIFCVDLDKGETLWTNRMGVSAPRTHAADLNGDGIDELIVQCYSPENGVSGAGTTDAGTSYVLCMDQSGNILWKKRFVGVHIGTTAAAADVTGDGRPEVVAVCSSTQHMDMGYAAVLSASGRTLAERSDLGGLYGLAVADFNGDGADEIVTGSPDGSVVMLDGDLNIVAGFTDTVDFTRIPNWSSRSRTVPDIRDMKLEQLFNRVIPYAAFDIDGDGDIETLCLSTAWAHVHWRASLRGTLCPPRGDLVVLNSALEEEARVVIRPEEWGLTRVPFDAPASLKTNIYPVDMDGDGTREILLSNGIRGLYVFKVSRAEGGTP
ncbi:MAG: hypothetical protein KAW67_06970 [Candidatus Eisenbacteria sp.]|nr:hypothetical protein [Candidatus Eisenbacteria bacterium]